MKKSSRKKKQLEYDAFFMQMGEACNPELAQGDLIDDFAKQNEELLASWLEYNAKHGEKMRKQNSRGSCDK